MLEFFETETKVYTVSELCEGDLSAFIATRKSRRLPEPLIRCMLLPLLRALSHLHAHGIVHRDLKPSNILLRSFSDPADLCLADFDGAHVDSPSRVPKPMETLIGTPFYIAPELVRGLPYGAEVDLYSLGVIAYELAAGETPFADSASYASLYGRIAGAEWEFPAGCGSPELRSLVKGLMHPDPARRTPCREALAHPFFAGPAAVQKRPGLGDRMMSGTAVVWRSETGELFPVGRWGEAVQAGS
ncbi:kinase-like domain-containing protein [Hyaloraphidium curvatum]|nr:kinase-like domain-containing protein [Hyaloraphidium curvatum]